MVISENKFGDIIELSNDFTLNFSYWDCECEHAFIHHVSKKNCGKCLSKVENQPNSREGEIDLYYIRKTLNKK